MTSLGRKKQKRADEWRQRVAQQRHAQSRQKVLTAARDLLTRSDYAAVSVEQIARRAGVAPATVYNRFGSKAGVAAALFEAPLQELQAAAERDLAAGVPLESAVRQHFQRLGEMARRHEPLIEALWYAVSEYAMISTPPATSMDPRRIAPMPQPLVTILQHASARDVRTGPVSASRAAAMMTNAFLIRFFNGDDPHTIARETTDLLLYGICGQAPRRRGRN